MKFLPVFLFLWMAAAAQNTFPPIGSWREHLPYNSTIDVTASAQKIYAATPFSLFTVDRASGEVGRLSKVSGLSETGISAIRFDEASNRLYIAYTNSNIDVLDAKRLHNIPGLKRRNSAGDKTIYHFYPSGNRCYLSTGLGVLVLNTDKYEIGDAWLLGAGGRAVKTVMLTRDTLHFYAATAEGLRRTPLNNPNPSDFRSWETLSGTAGLPAGACGGVVTLHNKVIAWQGTTLFISEGSGWRPFFSNGAPIVSINQTGERVAVCQSFVLGGPTRVTVLNSDGTIYKTVQGAPSLSYPQKAVVTGNELWVADLYGALSQWKGQGHEQYKPNSPEGIATGQLISYNNVVYAAAGSVNSAWNYLYNRNGIYRLSDGQWTNTNQFRFPQLDSLMDFITLAVDPRDESLWAGSFGGGLLHLKSPGVFEIYKQGSPLRPPTGDPTSYRVSGLAFDKGHNLWVANFGADPFLHVRKNSGSWQSFTAPFAIQHQAVADIVIDEADQKWILAPKGNGVICFNHGASLENGADDKWRLFRSGGGNGNLPAGEVLSLAKDRSGFIWVGTSDGIGVFQCPETVFSSSCEAVLPVIRGGNFANYLFKGEEVRSIAVDGADRKWVATKNGAWLISPDGDAVIHHFTEENSGLLSNDVKSITVNGSTGEVFFATAKGIAAFRGTATEGVERMESLAIFPNPVPPGFGGTIGLRGLKEGSYVKITELNGRLLYQTRSNGGQAVWNGKDYRGRTVASGVYLVLVTDPGGEERMAGKIVFVSK